MYLLLICVVIPLALGFSLAHFVAPVFTALLVVAGIGIVLGVVGAVRTLSDPSNDTSGPVVLAIVFALIAAAGIMLGLGALLGRALS